MEKSETVNLGRNYPRKSVIFILILFAFGLAFGAKHLLTRLQDQGISPYMRYPSLLPQLDHPIAIRFDPSFYYDRKKRPRDLAKILAKKWQAAGVNLVFYRAYDPQYGAFYRTEYRFNEMDDYGKYDLLKHVIEACHDRKIKVYAWLQVHNHGGAWKQNRLWRARGASGTDYRAKGFAYPLCARRPAAREWWYGFLRDLLERYPQIDGIDFGEPVVSWSQGAACFCDLCTEAFKTGKNAADSARIRAQALTELLGDSVAIVHKAGKKACITTVQSARDSGVLITPKEFMQISGFDLDGVLHAGTARTPDIICPEFIWQELKSRSSAPSPASVFNPEWTESALQAFLAWIDTPVEVIAHLEITDFPGVQVDGGALEKSLRAAIRGGAQGIDVYSSNQLDQKDAWKALAAIDGLSRKKKTLVLFDPDGGENDAFQVGALLRHFNVDVSFKPLSEYSQTPADQYDTLFYVGVVSGSEIPEALLADLVSGQKTICWLGFNIEAALRHEKISNALGLEYIGVEKERFKAVRYRNIRLSKKDPWTTVVNAFNKKKCRVMALAHGIDGDIPYAVRSGRRFWYFADVPTSHAIEGGRYLVFSDLLHDILNERHKTENLALVRIEDVHPLTDPDSLEEIADFLVSRKVPFHVSVVPFYVNPEKNTYVGLQEKPRLIKAIKYMIKRGGSVIMHGTTHQRFGETTADYEFWDPVNDRPSNGDNPAAIREKIETGLREFWSAGIYPLMWETPHYAGSKQLYSVVDNFFSVSMERRQAIDRLGTDQSFPYLVAGDRRDRLIVPENLGYVPLSSQKAEIILNPARNMKVVRDGVASFFFHPFVDLNVLKQIIKSMQKEGFRFTTIGDLSIRVETSFGVVTNTSGTVSLSARQINGKEERLAFPGILKESQTVQTVPDKHFTQDVTLRKGELYAAHFILPRPGLGKMKTGAPGGIDENLQLLRKVPNFYGEQCEVPRPVILSTSHEPFKLEEAAQAMASIFELVGVSVLRQHISDFSQIHPDVNLVLLPENAANMLSEDQVKVLVQTLRQGTISLITSGFTTLSDELGIEKIEGRATVASVHDNYFSDVEIRWHPPQQVHLFESPGDVSYIYNDVATGNPLVISGRAGKGDYMFINTPMQKDLAGKKDLYPYLLTHIFRSFRLFPLISKADAEIYFNPAEREGISIETLIKDWRRSGVRSVYVTAWQIFPDWTYDYDRLIRLAHTNGMLVYAWFELPYVNEKFWLDHPRWREKNAFGKDVMIGWRKPMAMGDPDCRSMVIKELEGLLESYDWDGVVLDRMGWETSKEKLDPAAYTPFHPTLCSDFNKRFGFDPKVLFDPDSTHYFKHSPESLEQFEAYRQSKAREWALDVVASIARMEKTDQNDWEIILTYDARRSRNGLSLDDYLFLKKFSQVRLQLATDMRNQWKTLSPNFDMVRLVFASGTRPNSFHPRAVTAYPTGTTLYTMLYGFTKDNTRFSLFSENALFEVDKQMLPFLSSVATGTQWAADHLRVEMSESARLAFFKTNGGRMMIDGKLAGSFYNESLLVPVGLHRVAPETGDVFLWQAMKSKTRLVDCSADLLKITVTNLGLEITYWADRRAAIVVSEKPLEITVDGAAADIRYVEGTAGWAMMLPKGTHTVRVKTRAVTDLFLVVMSLIVSNTILLISLAAIASLLIISAVTVFKKKVAKNKTARG